MTRVVHVHKMKKYIMKSFYRNNTTISRFEAFFHEEIKVLIVGTCTQNVRSHKNDPWKIDTKPALSAFVLYSRASAA